MTDEIRKSAVFFDRDGVITSLVPPHFNRGPRSLSEVSFLDSPGEALLAIHGLGFINLVVTNQPDISRGFLSIAEHEKICTEVLKFCPTISQIYVCPHDNSENCLCRKPRPGLLDKAAKEFNLDLSRSWIVGDKWTDILAGRSRGLRTVLFRNEFSWLPTSQGSPPQNLSADIEIYSLTDLVALLIDVT